ncbi:MAG: transcriptional repressor [Desulfatiglandaceae bacterium]|jgi:Fur family ferric uptake transcriptional regulator
MKREIKDTNLLEKANLRALLKADRVDRVEDRLNIVDAFLDTEGHVTLEELFRLLEERDYHYEVGFVRQCMNRMVELGFAQREKFESQPIRYEHRHLGRHHDHLVCTKCGKIVEFANDNMEQLQLQIASAHGFQMLQHRMEIYGLCDECFSQRARLIPLSMAKPGEQVELKEITVGAGGKSRLASMGLRVGDRLEIINNDAHGRLILGRDCTRIAMGRGMAEKMLVSPLLPEQKITCKETENGSSGGH